MHPKEFKEYWDLTPAEFADLLHRSRDAIHHWLNGTKDPSAEVLRDVQIIHLRWLEWQLQDEMLPPIHRELYELARERRALKLRALKGHGAN